MKKTWCSGIFLLLVVPQAFSVPENYQQLSAVKKQEYLWQQSTSTSWQSLPPWSGGGWSSIIENISSLLTLPLTFNHVGDEVPKGRRKIIHQHGVVAKVSWKPAKNSPFTGLYHRGAAGFARFSLAGDPGKMGFTPGMAIKLLVDEQPSRNIFAMHSLEGQGEDTNFFAHDFSNEIPRPKGIWLRLAEAIFNRVKAPANKLSVQQIAEVTRQGAPVEDAVAPEQLIFKPSEAAKAAFLASTGNDMRSRFAQLKPPLVLYQVVGIYEGEQRDVGELVLESVPLASRFGDYSLFFQHPR